MLDRVTDPRSLCGAIRAVLEYFEGVAPKPTVRVGSSIGVSEELKLIDLSTAILEIIDDYEAFVLPQVLSSFRKTAFDTVVE